MFGVFVVAWLARISVLALSPTEARYLGEDWMHILLVADRLGDFTLVRPFNPWGYPLIISPLVALGMDAFSIAFWFQPVLTSLIAPLAFCAVFSPRRIARAWIAGIACALHPGLVDLGCKMGWDAPYIVFVLASVVALLGREPRRPGWAGFLAATAWFIRTPGLAVIGGLFAALIWRRKWRAAKRFMVVLIATVAVYTTAGTVMYGKLVLISTHHEFLGNYRSEWGGWKRVIGEDKRAERRRYLKFAWENPDTFTRERFISAVNFLTPWPITGQRWMSKVLIGAPHSLLMGAVIWGWIAGGRRKRRWLLAIASVWLCTFVFHFALFTKTRYRIPMVPPLIVMAALTVPPIRRHRLVHAETMEKRGSSNGAENEQC